MSGKRAHPRNSYFDHYKFCHTFYGIFLSHFLGHTFGEENVGLYQLVFPVYALGISFPVPEPNLLFPAALHRKMLQAIRKKQKNY